MNLFYKPSLSELASLIDESTPNSENFNVIVDYDGEVLIDSDVKVSQPTLEKYKFYFHAMKGIGMRTGHTISYLKFLNQLFKNLVFCWDKEISGRVDYQLISNLQKRINYRDIRDRLFPIGLIARAS